jgi:hypothetical protein
VISTKNSFSGAKSPLFSTAQNLKKKRKKKNTEKRTLVIQKTN